tara:strand:+ start:921 stop:1181 length:261 start_codon:yes stop_codon:yes gene_type:complete
MSKFLVKFTSDWADEFQCEQYTIFANIEAAQFAVKQAIENGGYFGTNEGWDEGELTEDAFTITEITYEEACVIKSLLGTTFGTGIL